MSSKNYNVLIVDDSLTNLQVIASMLDKDKYRAIFAESGKAAINILENSEIPDVILLDIMMPEMDGFAFKRILNENDIWVHIPIIVVSALQEEGDKTIAFDLGCVDYMVKPINKAEVNSRINVQIQMKEQKEKLRKMNEDLIIANNTRDKIFSIISHDLRTSVGNIRNVFKFILDGLIEVDKDEDIIIDSEIASRNTFNLLENLLFWAKSQQGHIVYNPEMVNVSKVIHRVIDIEKGSIVNKKINCQNQVEDNLMLVTDKVLFTIMIRNLVANAIKFSNLGGEINIFSKKNNKNIVFNVSDNGVGISKENLENLQSKIMFTTTGTLNEKGTGLGLVLVNECVERCKGSFEIQSELGKGSQFSLLLPQDKN